MAQLAFEVFNVSGLYFADEPVLSLYAVGKSSGLVVDIGHETTGVCPFPSSPPPSRLNHFGPSVLPVAPACKRCEPDDNAGCTYMRSPPPTTGPSIGVMLSAWSWTARLCWETLAGICTQHLGAQPSGCQVQRLMMCPDTYIGWPPFPYSGFAGL